MAATSHGAHDLLYQRCLLALDTGSRGSPSRCPSGGPSAGGSPWRWISSPEPSSDSPRASGSKPKYVVCDQGKQFWCRSFKSWCKRRSVRPRYGAIGQPASIAIVERYVRSPKQECTRCLLVPMSLAAMRRELSLYAIWFNTGTRVRMNF